MNMTTFFDNRKIRKDFPMLAKMMHGKPLIYLDSAATAQKPECVIEAMNTFYREGYGTVHRAVYELATRSTENYQRVREKVCAFLGASKSEEIIFTRGTTESINLVAYSFGKAFIRPGDEILISAMEHHSNIVPWQIMCEDRGAILKVIPFDNRGELIFDEFEKLLSSRTKLVSITHVSNALGTRNPIEKMIKLAHARGAKVLVDGAQSAPHMEINVQQLDADFFVFSGHKLMGPTGIGVLYGKEELLNQMPPYQGGGDMIASVTFEKTTYNELPLKFEAGTPMIAEVIGLGSAIDYLKEIGMQQIERYEQELLSYATKELKKIKGLTIVGEAEDKGAIISFVVDGVHPLDLGTLLDLKGVAIRTGHHCTQPVMSFFGVLATCRASFAFYNTFEEIDLFKVALESSLKLLT